MLRLQAALNGAIVWGGYPLGDGVRLSGRWVGYWYSKQRIIIHRYRSFSSSRSVRYPCPRIALLYIRGHEYRRYMRSTSKNLQIKQTIARLKYFKYLQIKQTIARLKHVLQKLASLQNNSISEVVNLIWWHVIKLFLPWSGGQTHDLQAVILV